MSADDPAADPAREGTGAASSVPEFAARWSWLRNRAARFNELLQAVETCPGDFQRRYDLAAFLETFAQEAHRDAEEQLILALRRSPDDPRLKVELGIHQAETLRSPAEAAATLSAVLQSGCVPPSLEPYARYVLAKALWALGRASEAHAELDRGRAAARERGGPAWERLLDREGAHWETAPTARGDEPTPAGEG